jgi:cob(I)alamin adenosyltransferase
MVRLNKIYTRKGDDGTTALVGGKRVKKTSLRLEAYGTVDELNAFLGILRTQALGASPDIMKESEQALRQIQNDLFDIGSLLAVASEDSKDAVFPPERTKFLETRMDEYQTKLEELTSFVLPGGDPLNAQAHVARTVCRRAERLLWRLNAEERLDAEILRYLNRLSDYLFVYSRWVARLGGGKEFLWDTDLSRGGRSPDRK